MIQHTEKRKSTCEHESRDGRDAATSQGMPAATRTQEGQGLDSPLEPLKRSPANTLIDLYLMKKKKPCPCGLQNCDRMNFCCFKPRVGGNLFQQPPETAITEILLMAPTEEGKGGTGRGRRVKKQMEKARDKRRLQMRQKGKESGKSWGEIIH